MIKRPDEREVNYYDDVDDDEDNEHERRIDRLI